MKIADWRLGVKWRLVTRGKIQMANYRPFGVYYHHWVLNINRLFRLIGAKVHTSSSLNVSLNITKVSLNDASVSHGCVLLENTPLTKFIQSCIYPGPEWCIFHILTSEDIDDVISCFFTVVCAKSQKWRAVDLLSSQKTLWNPSLKNKEMLTRRRLS